MYRRRSSLSCPLAKCLSWDLPKTYPRTRVRYIRFMWTKTPGSTVMECNREKVITSTQSSWLLLLTPGARPTEDPLRPHGSLYCLLPIITWWLLLGVINSLPLTVSWTLASSCSQESSQGEVQMLEVEGFAWMQFAQSFRGPLTSGEMSRAPAAAHLSLRPDPLLSHVKSASFCH